MKKIFTSAFALLCLTTAVSAQNAGSLDLNFSEDGMYTTDYGFHDNITDVKIDPSSGKIVAVGTAINPAYAGKLLVMRLNADGTPDDSFADNGSLIIEDYNESYAYDCHIYTDGGILVAGAVADENYAFSMIAMKLKNDGSFDTDFGTNGIVIPTMGAGDDFAQAVAVHANGNIYLAGKSMNDVYQNVPSIYALDANGDPIASFGNNGLAQISVNSEDNIFNAIAIDSNDRLVATGHYGWPITKDGQTNFDILVARFNNDGTPDESFSDDGVEITAISEQYIEDAFGLAIYDNQIFVSGYTTLDDFSFDAFIVALADNGALDASFGENGMFMYNQGIQDVFFDIKADETGSLFPCGTTGGFFFDFREFLLVKLDNTGTLESTFGTDGVVTTTVGTTYSEGNSLALGDNDRIVVGGKSNNGGNNEAAFAQYYAASGVSVAEWSVENFSTYPNPAKSGATIQCSVPSGQNIASASLIDSKGAKINLTTTRSNMIQLPTLSSGLYTLVFTLDDGNYKTSQLLID